MKPPYKGKITYFGSEKEIARAAKVVGKRRSIRRMDEGKARLKIQELIDRYGLKASILLDGNTVWSKKRILRNLEKIRKHGTLYNPDQAQPPILSHYFYQFLYQVCGSMAHYDIHGWIYRYPTVDHLKAFFLKNEFGTRVKEWVPPWYADALVVVDAIEARLLPFKRYMEMRDNR